MSHQSKNESKRRSGAPDGIVTRDPSAVDPHHVDAKIQEAIQSHQSNRLDTAEQAYRDILNTHPNHSEALHLLGLIAQEKGNYSEAENLISKALQFSPLNSGYYNSLGITLQKMGQPEQAIANYKKALELSPGSAELYNNLANACSKQGRNDEALHFYRQALAIVPESVEVLNNMGTVLLEQEKLEQSLACFSNALAINPVYTRALYNAGLALQKMGRDRQALDYYRGVLKINPEYFNAHLNIGIILRGKRQCDDAIDHFQKALKIKPDSAEAYNNIGTALRAKGNSSQAAACFSKALEIRPVYPEASSNLGLAFVDENKLDDARQCFEKALQMKPDYLPAYNHIGNLLNLQNNIDESVAYYRKALDIDSHCPESHFNLGCRLMEQNRLEEAVACFQRAIEIRPHYPDALNNLAAALKEQGRLKESIACYRKTIEIDPSLSWAHSNLLFALNFDPESESAELYDQAQAWWRRHGQDRAPSSDYRNRPDPQRRLKIGYVSPDFWQHPVSLFFLPLISGHDRNWVEVYCYAEVAQPDQTTEQVKRYADHWVSTLGLTDRQVADRIKQDRIDILVDLAGHTARNRLLAFAYKPAPIQVTWLGYGNTTGMPVIDYFITDEVADPAGIADQYYCEKLVRLPQGFLCYGPPDVVPDIQGLTNSKNDPIVFGSFNNVSKLNRRTIVLWSQILQRVPESRLVLKSKQLRDQATRDRYLDMFSESGVNAERIHLLPRTQSVYDHLAQYHQIHIALDPHPYNGTTTTCEALWMGVPVVTLRGDCHYARVGASLLTRVGLTDLIAESEQQFVDNAVALANDISRLSELRLSLRSIMASSSLCNSKNFARDMEEKFREMWRTWCSSQRSTAPTPINTQYGTTKSDLPQDRRFKAHRGVLYITWGEFSEEILQRSIDSVRKFHHELPIHVERLPEESNLLDKAKMFDISPFAETLFLDMDTVVMGRLDYAFEKASQFGLACGICECPWARRYRGLEGDIIEYNTGVLFFSAKAAGLFKAWREAAEQVDSSILFYNYKNELREMPLNDQASFALAVERTGFHPFVLPYNWNFRPRIHKSLFGPVKIWHDYKDVYPSIGDWNTRQSPADSIIRFNELRGEQLSR